MTKIAIVGAGSLVFTRTLVSDLLQQEATADAEIHLVDIDDQRLRDAVKAVEAIAMASKRSVPVVASTDRAEGVRGCNYVVNTVQVGGKKATAVDFDLPEKFGVRQTIADTHGIGGISRALRTLPAVVEICSTVAEHAPGAYFLNYTNPDVYPRLREFARAVDVNEHPDGIRLELLRRFGYFVSESSVHNAEYYPWFLRQGAEAETHGVRVREYLYRLDDLEQKFEAERRALTDAGASSLPPQSTEYAPRVIAALEAGASYRFMGNVVNSGEVISNLPDQACVEVPCFVDGSSIIAGSVGRLPEQCAALNRCQVNVQLLTVAGILDHSRDTIYQAAFLDPLLSSQLTLDEITSLVDELVAAHGNPSGLR